jgi:hypothetical protein
MLTYLDRSPSQHSAQRPKRLMVVAISRARGLAVKTTPRLFPREVVYDGQVGAPENGSAVGHGLDACIYETYQRRWP